MFTDFDGSTSYDDEPYDDDATCGAHYTTGGHDTYGTECDKSAGHYPKTKHEGPNPIDQDAGRVSWTGGGMCAGDPIPYYDVVWHEKIEPDEEEQRRIADANHAAHQRAMDIA